MKEFSTDHYYMDDLQPNEVWTEGNSRHPMLRGLMRLAHENRGGIKHTESDLKHYESGVDADGTPWRSAVVSVSIEFGDGSCFGSIADAHTDYHEEPYSNHIVALAESKAITRAIRQALNISECSREEMGSQNVADGPITGAQKAAIRRMAESNNHNIDELIERVVGEPVALGELTKNEAMKVCNEARLKTRRKRKRK